jgi:intein/homing endonuclease
MELTCEMSELIGSIIGDGNIYNGKQSYVELTGHPTEELTYFNSRLKPIISQELNYNVRLFLHSRGLKFRINSKKFVLWLKSLGIPTGKSKGRNALIPANICSSWELSKSCIRGIFDADGSVYFDKRATYSRPYPRIALYMINKNLILQISKILKEQGFNPTLSRNVRNIICLYLNGFDEVKKFLIKIGFANSKHHERIKNLYPNLITYNLI